MSDAKGEKQITKKDFDYEWWWSRKRGRRSMRV